MPCVEENCVGDTHGWAGGPCCIHPGLGVLGTGANSLHLRWSDGISHLHCHGLFGQPDAIRGTQASGILRALPCHDGQQEGVSPLGGAM